MDDHDRWAVTSGLMTPGVDAYDALRRLLTRPAWHTDALCRGHGPVVFFTGAPARAVEVCARCPVSTDCAEAGQDEPYGVWGGTPANARPRRGS